MLREKGKTRILPSREQDHPKEALLEAAQLVGCGKPSKDMPLAGVAEAVEGGGKGRPCGQGGTCPSSTTPSCPPNLAGLTPHAAQQVLLSRPSSPFTWSSQLDSKFPIGKGATDVTVVLLSWAHCTMKAQVCVICWVSSIMLEMRPSSLHLFLQL